MGDSSKCEESKERTPTVENPKVKYDWYQTETHVTINVMIKNLTEDKIKISFQERSLNVDLPASETFSLVLSKAINPSKCTYRIKPTKVELKLKKRNEDLWTVLEGTKTEVRKEPVSLTKRNWDKLVETELKDDAAEGEAALNELFQKIYTEGSDEVKKAMNKSFLESGGTVLSTNWNEVGEKKVDIKPPDGMEWKKWDEV